MAARSPQVPAPAVSQKQRKAALRKERRRRKRQALAHVQGCDPKNAAEEEEEVNDASSEENVATVEERLRLHEEWLERERLAQDEFRLKSEREEASRQRKEEEERMIKEEWDSQQKKEQKEKEQKQQEKRDREEAVQKMLDEAENQLQNGGPWMNPEAPRTVNSDNYGTERDIANCPFFLKTGACRFGDRCSRKHVYPTASPTLMVRAMFTTFGMEEVRRDDYDIDACLEHSEEELQESFLDFYHDVLPEFKSVGRVVQFKVCCNHELHLRGNVYVQFETEEQCKEAFIKFNGRWYAGRQLHCEISPVTRWKNAICGLFDRQKCPKGKHCNFLHVFRNPGREFWEADRDLHLSPDRNVKGGRSDGWHSERYSERSWRQRRYSRSPVRSERSHSRRDADRQRSRSRERRDSYHYREDRQSSRSRHSERTDRRRSRDRSRSRSRDGERRRLQIRSRDKDKEHNCRKRSEERDSRDEDEDTRREDGKNSRSTSRERKRIKQSKERSSKKLDKSKKIPTDSTNTPHRHKHSKKSKKSKKKHKKKSHIPDVTTSSGESEKEKESEETEDNPSAPSPSGDINETKITQENDFEDNNLCSEAKSEQSNTEPRSEQTENGDVGSS
ncbi:U2 small nuclear ribonucleoprotein auxiliary factor 35 kDa subunit-related protein 1 [Cololabis saira]|uniref:U2 small nuclear ribonucleoprotein auxiliary factor 35 kDa subunit-related protein 1 n=1 Tax=Cololabis saira TaxID=129043 RepID=UPI002AD45366|nr:U2 small nuclear ribonucleoprotein auxiliary factor 35 kDa subunit-related protein 1 [Cololabis saira]